MIWFTLYLVAVVGGCTLALWYLEHREFWKALAILGACYILAGVVSL